MTNDLDPNVASNDTPLLSVGTQPNEGTLKLCNQAFTQGSHELPANGGWLIHLLVLTSIYTRLLRVRLVMLRGF